jgi:small subunit ribosomal protein S17
MADDPNNDPPAADADAPAAEVEAVTESPAESSTPEVAATPDTEAPEAAEPAAPASEPVSALSSKERRRKERSKHVGEASPARSPQERHATRVRERQAKAVRRRARRLQERAKALERRAARPAGERSEIAQLAPVHAPVEGKRRVRQGIVVSDKAEKTITVRIDVARPHRRYEKIVRSSSTLHAHDENNDAHEGDVVRVIESRPLSRSKRWKLVDVLERAR